MKKYITAFAIVFSLIVIGNTSLMAQQNPFQEVNARIMQKMKDSLSLNEREAKSIDSLNLLIQANKLVVRSQYQHQDSIRKYIQRQEQGRDSLYLLVLPSEKFLLYKQKKGTLLNNN